MELDHALDTYDFDFRTGGLATKGRRLARGVAIAGLLAFGALAIAPAGWEGTPATPSASASADGDLAASGRTTRPAPESPLSGGGAQPDRVADFVGGAAARVYFDDGQPVPGDLFLLMATAGSSADARLYDQTPFPLDPDKIHPEVTESNREAARAVERITGADLLMVDFTSAPGGGPSAGLTYAIAYLNTISDGAFTGELVVAATGSLRPHGYIHPINAIDEKVAAAGLAEADVLFTPSIPAIELVDVHSARVVGELFRARNTGSALADERQWDKYHIWGVTRPDNDMDVVGIRHIGDVAAYLCGAGSEYACDIVERLERLRPDPSVLSPEAAPSNRHPSGARTGAAIQIR